MARIRNEQGFGLVELLIAIVVINIALLTLVAAFSSGTMAIVRASKVSTAATIADAQMESYRAMPSRDIGLDLSVATVNALDTTYKQDTACYDSVTAKNCTQAGVTASKALIAPTGNVPDSCTSINGWYPNTLPCTPSRTITGASSPDKRSYRVDVYIDQLPAVVASATVLGQRTRKQVTIVVRDGALISKTLARETSIFDCSTGMTPNSTDC